jgi:hypothetical protein
VVSAELSSRSEDEATRKQILSWQNEPFLTELIEIYREEDRVNPIDSKWIILGHQQQEKLEVAG